MNLLPKDYTSQENIIAECLSEFGLRYEQQHDFWPYTVDFYIPELKMIIEADGKHGHLRKRDVKRDMELMQLAMVKGVLHIKETTYESIKETLWRALNKLTEES